MATQILENSALTAREANHDERIPLAGMGRVELAEALTEFGIDPKKVRMRSKQIFHWIYNYGVTDWDAMTNIAKDLRASLAEKFSLERPELIERQVSVDGTRKYLIRMAPGIEVESVFIKLWSRGMI